MALSGPRTHHHDDDGGESGPAVFADINITPLTDIFLVLLIIFMVTSTALVEAGQGGAGAGVRVDLPKGAARELQSAARDFTVALLKDGSTGVDGKGSDVQILRARCEQHQQETPAAHAIFSADTAGHA